MLKVEEPHQEYANPSECETEDHTVESPVVSERVEDSRVSNHEQPVKTTRSGRVVKAPDRLDL